jgi:hypothetical protein
MIVLVTDPVTNQLVKNPKRHPFIILGSGHNITKIYFESEKSKTAYLRKHPVQNTSY